MDLSVDVVRAAASTSAFRAPVPERVGPFEVIETVSASTSSAVLRARRAQGTRRDVVRVVVDRRPRDEAALELLRGLDVPGVARLIGWGQLPDGRGYIESEQPRGPTLEEHVVELGALSLDRALALFSSLLDTLARVHAHGLAHGALDARRIVLPASRRPAVLDLGIAARGDGSASALVTTPPEVWRGKRADARSDLYAAGILLFYAIAGRYPFVDEDPLALCHQHLRADAPPLATFGVAVCSEVEEALARFLAKDPRDRWPSADLARAALEKAQLRARAERAPASYECEVPAPAGYRFVRRLGEGGAAAVFEAVHETLDKVFAVKVLRPSDAPADEARERFLREARLAASLDHPGIVRVHDAREEGGRLYLMMELVDGESLKSRLVRDGAMPEDEAIEVARAVLAALEQAHARGIIHRDIKPDNVLVSSGGRVKLTDFGLARYLSAADITQTGYLVGTPIYMSPEQCRGEPVDARSDLYSLGATLYHMISGRPPFSGPTVLSILDQHLNAAAVPVTALSPATSPGLARVIHRLLMKEPSRRYASAREVLEGLDDAARGLLQSDAWPRAGIRV